MGCEEGAPLCIYVCAFVRVHLRSCICACAFTCVHLCVCIYMRAFQRVLSCSACRKELLAKLVQAEEEKGDAAQLAREFEALTEENRTLKLAQSQCVEQLEKLRIQYQKRQGSS